jgi:hypothetical protein
MEQDRKGMLMVEFVQQGTAITSEAYCRTLIKLRRAIQNERRGMLTYGVVLLHGNARPNTAARTRALLDHFNFELFDHCFYSPDIAPSDCHLKNWLGSQRFNSNEEFMEGVKTWLSSQAADFFDTGIHHLIS